MAASAAPGRAKHGPGAADLAWLAGCWVARLGGLEVQEHWLDPQGGELLGVSRTLRGDSVIAFEFLRIHRTTAGLVLAAAPSGQAPAEFGLLASAPGAVEFHNPDHDFPRQIRYRAAGADSLIAEIAGPREGVERRVRFPYARVPCMGGPER
jgi:hypothetical protein